MKARLLKKLLNDTEYFISNEQKYIAVGSPMCHNLISVDKETLKIKYALDTFNEGRKAIKSMELEFIWDKLHELVLNGQIQDIINGKDIIENPLPVFTVEDGLLVESVTDEYGWPNTDDNGVCMYDNTHFPTKEQAIEYGIQEYEAGKSIVIRRMNELEKQIQELRKERALYDEYIIQLNDIK